MQQSKHPGDSRVEMTEIVLPQHTNSLGSIFGGVVMSWVDIAAAICAQRHCNSTVVTASIDTMHFLAPVKLGWVVNIKASVNRVFNSSCEVGVKVTAENPIENIMVKTATAYLTFVSIDEKGRKKSMPALIPVNYEDHRRHENALTRRKSRLELKQQLKK